MNKRSYEEVLRISSNTAKDLEADYSRMLADKSITALQASLDFPESQEEHMAWQMQKPDLLKHRSNIS